VGLSPEEMRDLQQAQAMVRMDPRHRLGTSIARPEKDGVIMVLRCDPGKGGCGRLATVWETRRYGKCPTCDCRNFWQSYPRGTEWIRLIFWNVFQRWQVHGEKGRGWKSPAQEGVS
jgi:hypothetical protein